MNFTAAADLTRVFNQLKKPSPGRTGVVDVLTNRIFNLDG